MFVTMRHYCSILVIASVAISATNAFVVPSATKLQHRHASTAGSTSTTFTIILYDQRRPDASRSGNKRERLDKLAELEDSRVETDKGFVLKAAGGFVGLLLLLLIVAYASGVLDGVMNAGY